MQQELQQGLQQESLQFSDVCDTEPGTHFPNIVRQARLQCLVDLGLDLASSYSPLVVKMACDGVYRYTPRQGDDLRKLAAEYAAAGGSCAGVGRGTTFSRLVREIRDAL